MGPSRALDRLQVYGEYLLSSPLEESYGTRRGSAQGRYYSVVPYLQSTNLLCKL